MIYSYVHITAFPDNTQEKVPDLQVIKANTKRLISPFYLKAIYHENSKLPAPALYPGPGFFTGTL